MSAPRFEMDFDQLPDWTVKKLKELFGKTDYGNRIFDLPSWKSSLSSYITAIPDDELQQFLIKGIEYTEKCIEIHNKTCFNSQCGEVPVWKQKISIAKNELQKLTPATPATSRVIIPKISYIGSKIDLIRILNALYELRRIEDLKGLRPSKGQFMKETGEFFGVDLSDYEIALSQAFSEGKIEANVKIFDEMKTITQKIWTEKLNK